MRNACGSHKLKPVEHGPLTQSVITELAERRIELSESRAHVADLERKVSLLESVVVAYNMETDADKSKDAAPTSIASATLAIFTSNPGVEFGVEELRSKISALGLEPTMPAIKVAAKRLAERGLVIKTEKGFIGME